MKKQDIDKTLRTIDDSLEIFEDYKKAQESDEKVTWLEGGTLFVKHSGKAIRFATALPEIGSEILDIDGEEGKEIADHIMEYFGKGPEVVEAVGDISKGAGLVNQGVQKLIEIKKSQG